MYVLAGCCECCDNTFSVDTESSLSSKFWRVNTLRQGRHNHQEREPRTGGTTQATAVNQERSHQENGREMQSQARPLTRGYML